MNNTIKLGTYQHYKGDLYQVENTATHSETEEEMVIYYSLKNTQRLWVRPLKMFKEYVEISGEQVPRFAYLDEK